MIKPYYYEADVTIQYVASKVAVSEWVSITPIPIG